MVSRTVRDKLRRVAAGTPGRKKAKRPVAARGKTTRREAGKRMMNELIQNLGKRGSAIKDRVGAMSPGKLRAITGKTAIGKRTMKASDMPAPTRKAFQTMGMSPGTAGMNKAAMALAKKIKPTGRLNTDDIKKATAMLKRAAASMRGKKGK